MKTTNSSVMIDLMNQEMSSLRFFCTEVDTMKIVRRALLTLV